MIRLVIPNQRGGVAKTTTAVTLARCYADFGLRVLLVDTDPQGSVHQVTGLKPQRFLHDFLINKVRLPECVAPAGPNLDVLASNRTTIEADAHLFGQTGREYIFDTLFPLYEDRYDAVLIDCAPSVSLFQTCAMVYARNLLIPIAMESLSVQGAIGSITGAQYINKALLSRAPESYHIRTRALLPVMVNRRYALTDMVMKTVGEISEQYQVPVLPAIRTDQAVAKAAKSRRFLQDFDAKSKALEDYQAAAAALLEIMGYRQNAQQFEAEAAV